MNITLTTIERAGGNIILHKSATILERKALELYLRSLKAAGHAIVCDEVSENGEYQGTLRVCHFLSCVKCKGEK